MAEKEIVVNIFGREYSIMSDQEEYIRRLEFYVNALMQRLREENDGVSYTRLLVLACMYLADEVHKAKGSAKAFLSSVEEDIGRLILQMRGGSPEDASDSGDGGR